MTPRHALRRAAPALTALALWGAALLLEIPLSASARSSAWRAARQADGSPAMAQVAGSFRVVAANVLWLKVEAYHHAWEERNLDWTRNTDLLPMLRAITYLDPHFVEAYGVHGFLLTRQGRPGDGLAILNEGIRNNPNRYEGYEAVGMLYAWSLKRRDQAIPCFARALALAPDDFHRRRLARTLRTLEQEARKAVATPRRAEFRAADSG